MRLTHCSRVRLRAGDNDRTATGPGVPIYVSAGNDVFTIGTGDPDCLAEDASIVGFGKGEVCGANAAVVGCRTGTGVAAGGATRRCVCVIISALSLI